MRINKGFATLTYSLPKDAARKKSNGTTLLFESSESRNMRTSLRSSSLSGLLSHVLERVRREMVID